MGYWTRKTHEEWQKEISETLKKRQNHIDAGGSPYAYDNILVEQVEAACADRGTLYLKKKPLALAQWFLTLMPWR